MGTATSSEDNTAVFRDPVLNNVFYRPIDLHVALLFTNQSNSTKDKDYRFVVFFCSNACFLLINDSDWFE